MYHSVLLDEYAKLVDRVLSAGFICCVKISVTSSTA